MTLSIKVTASREAPPHSGGSYRHYLAGNVYGPDTDPPATLALVRRALAEGWAVAWPPETKVEPEVEVGDFADALALLGADPAAIAEALADDPPEPAGVDLAPVIDTLPPIDPELLLAALGPLPEGVHTLAGLYDEPGVVEAVEALYPPVEPIAVFDASDAIHEPPQEAPVEQAPDVPEPPAKAPKTATSKATKSRKPAARKKG